VAPAPASATPASVTPAAVPAAHAAAPAAHAAVPPHHPAATAPVAVTAAPATAHRDHLLGRYLTCLIEQDRMRLQDSGGGLHRLSEKQSGRRGRQNVRCYKLCHETVPPQERRYRRTSEYRLKKLVGRKSPIFDSGQDRDENLARKRCVTGTGTQKAVSQKAVGRCE
jgi:hypothetical protein